MPDTEDARSVMSVGDHLMELRRCLIHSLIGVGVLTVGTLWYGRDIVRWLCEPLFEAQRQLGLPRQTISLSVAGGFMVYVKVSLVAAVVVGLPWTALQLWRFIAPGLHRAERRLFLALVPYSLAMTVVSVAFVYYLFLPAALSFLLTFSAEYPPPVEDGRTSSLAQVTSFFNRLNSTLMRPATAPAGQSGDESTANRSLPSERLRIPTVDRDPQDARDGEIWFNRSLGELRIAANGKARVVQVVGASFMVPQIDINEYLNLAALSLFIMAISFQIPVAITIAAALDLIDPAAWGARRGKVLFACFLIGVFITPNQDLVSNVVFPLVLWGLFEIGLLTAKMVRRRGEAAPQTAVA
jgi:Tat protein translocase TatC